MSMIRLAIAIAALLAAPLHVYAQIEPAVLEALGVRSIGPAVMSGRVADVDVLLSDPQVMYAGTGTGGAWKSENGGLSWRPIFDREATSSIGAIAVSQSHPNVVWLGTGEGNPRNSMGTGAGLYRSDDAGETWSFVGLRESDRIHRIIIHPSNPDIVWVGVMGNAWKDTEERGVFRTTNGGRTWQKTLYVNERTGAGDLLIDPSNPDRLFAAMWEYRRLPWFFTSGGPGSGLHLSEDGGVTWRRLTTADGLPAGELGRIGLTISAQQPRVMYAIVEAARSAILRSDDGGLTWRSVNDTRGIANRPFYYGDIRVDPGNPDRVYNLFSQITVSEDGGRTFERLETNLHGDHHDLWIDPRDGRFMVLATDGGLGISRDRGATWQFAADLPLGQYYHVNVDMETPFNIYGGLQDNGSWRGPSSVWDHDAIVDYHWRRVGGGDGFGTLSDPADANYGYAMSQGGNLRRFNFVTGESKDIKPYHPQGEALRFNWSAAIAADPFVPATIYYGSQYVHRSTDRGDSWEIISPDLTTNDSAKQRQRESGGLSRESTGAENHTTIVTIAPSPVREGVIWVGTDDGNVQVTRDGGASWTNLAANIRGVPATSWVPHIEASKHAEGTAYVVFDNHRRGDTGTYIFRTTDFGSTWQSIGNGVAGFAHVLEEDPVEASLLFVGTEFGLFASIDGGAHWTKWSPDFPTVPVHALIVHPRDGDLVIGTHGRSLWVLDDVRPLRELAARPRLADSRLHIFAVPDAWQVQRGGAAGASSPGAGVFLGENRPVGALITFVARGVGTGDSAVVEIQDESGRRVRRFRTAAADGVNRISWNLRSDGWHGLNRFGPEIGAESDSRPDGPEVVPGSYRIRIALGGAAAEATVRVHDDPRSRVALADRQQRTELLGRAGRAVERARAAEARARALVAALQQLSTLEDQALRAEAERLRVRADSLVSQLDVGDMRSVYSSAASSWERPTRTVQARFDRADGQLGAAIAQLNAFMQDIASFRQRAGSALGDTTFPDLRPINEEDQ